MVERSQRIAGSPRCRGRGGRTPQSPRRPRRGRGPCRGASGRTPGCRRGSVRVDLIPQQDERVGQLFGRSVPEPHRHREHGVHAEAPGVFREVQGVGRLVGRCDAARAEDELDRPALGPRPDDARWKRGAGFGPDGGPVEPYPVLAGGSGLQARYVDQGVVVVPDAERGRGAPEYLDLAPLVRLYPDRGVRGARVAQERA